MKIDGLPHFQNKDKLRLCFYPGFLPTNHPEQTSAKPWFDDAGIKHIGLYDSLLDENTLNM